MASYSNMDTQRYTFDRYVELHEKPNGPGDSRPTAMQVVHDNGLEGQLTDRVMLVTGASTGIGVDTAHTLATTGARILLVVRNLSKGRATVEKIEAAVPVSRGKLELVEMDLLSLDSVRAAAKEILSKTDKLHVVVNNAGVAGTPKSTTPDGFDNMMQVNYLSHFLLFQLLQPLLLASSTPTFHSRVVNVSSLAHRWGSVDLSDINYTKPPYDPLVGYGKSKTAMNWMSNEIERRYAARGLHSIAVHPGGIQETNLAASHGPEFLAKMKDIFKIPGIMESFKSNEQGAATTIVAALDKELEGKGGIYLDDCGTYGPADMSEGAAPWMHGYAPWTFDEEGAKKLWAEACIMVKVDQQ